MFLAGRQPLVTDFTEYAVGTGTVSDWTRETGTSSSVITADATSGVTDRTFGTDSGTASPYTWNKPGTVTDVEVLTLGYFDATRFGGSASFVHARMQSGSEQMYSGIFTTSGGTSTQFAIIRFGATLATSPAGGPYGPGWFWFRLRVIGTTVSLKVWSLGAAEPASFAISATDSTYASGKVGLRPSNLKSTAWLSVGLGTAAAPGPSG